MLKWKIKKSERQRIKITVNWAEHSYVGVIFRTVIVVWTTFGRNQRKQSLNCLFNFAWRTVIRFDIWCLS